MPQTTGPAPRSAIGFAEFVALMALLMGLTAMSIDIMLPALPEIAAGFGVADPNDRQLMVTGYLLGFALGQPVYGPLSDRFGRRPMLVIGLVVFAIGTLGAFLAPDFGLLLLARGLQGFGSASARVVSVAVIRDRFAGRDMARVMSFVMMVFIMVPILAPSVGVGVLAVAEWHAIFGLLLLAGAVALVWVVLRLPETRHAEDRLPLTARSLAAALRTVVTTRRTIGYTVAMGFMFGSLMAYVGTAQQILGEVYALGDLFPLVFAVVAASMAVASFANSRLVGRFGMRRISHVALLAYVLASGVFAFAGFPEHPPLVALVGFLCAAFLSFGLVAPNFNALAMEPVGHIAGMASSFLGFYTTAVSALLGWAIGQAFDGTVRPLTIGFAVLGVLALIAVLVTERGVLISTAPRRGPVPSQVAGE